MDHIPPKLFKFCDFGYIIDPEYTDVCTMRYIEKFKKGAIVLDMDLEVKPYTGSNILTAGNYKFEMVLTGQNFIQVKKIFKVNIPEYWNDEERNMLNNGLSTEEI